MSGPSLAGDIEPRRVRVTQVEQHGIDTIPDRHRTSRPLDLFRIQFGGANTFATIILGTDLSSDAELGFAIVASVEMDDLGARGVVERIHERVQDRPVYVSVDIDVLDPAFAPGTGTPEAGGLTSRELLAVMRGFGDLDLVGADVVEVAPAYDSAQVTGIAAAHVLYELVSAMARRTRGDDA